MNDCKINGAPDLVVEILSPSTGYYDLTHKKRIYERFGVREYWILDPTEKTVEVFSHDGSGFVLAAQVQQTGRAASRLFPGLSVSVENLF
ncbi:MAG: Uma2 family endonuclease [Rhizobacter sp.]|nr:Uma2 family endonuclease [Chlorobiales bacterium]